MYSSEAFFNKGFLTPFQLPELSVEECFIYFSHHRILSIGKRITINRSRVKIFLYRDVLPLGNLKQTYDFTVYYFFTDLIKPQGFIQAPGNPVIGSMSNH